MSNQIHGRATIRINGQVIESEDDATLTVGGLKNTHKMVGQKGYYTQTSMGGKIVCKVPVTADFSPAAYQAMTGVEVTFESDVGRTYIMRNAVQSNDLAVQGGESGGTVELHLDGDPVEEMT